MSVAPVAEMTDDGPQRVEDLPTLRRLLANCDARAITIALHCGVTTTLIDHWIERTISSAHCAGAIRHAESKEEFSDIFEALAAPRSAELKMLDDTLNRHAGWRDGYRDEIIAACARALGIRS